MRCVEHCGEPVCTKIGLFSSRETHLCYSQSSCGNLETFQFLFLADNTWEGDEGRILL